MVAATIPIKTPQGQAELSTWPRRVSQRHRTVLFLVDGKRGATEVRSMALQAGAPASCFDELCAMGLILLPEPAVLVPTVSVPTVLVPIHAPPPKPGVLHVDLHLPGPDTDTDTDTESAAPDSILPPSRTLHPESISSDSVFGDTPLPDSWLLSDSDAPGAPDTAFAEARLILLRAVRAEAPLAGTLTLLRLRRARTRADLGSLLHEVETRITKPQRALAASQTMRRVRQLLHGRIGSSIAPA